MRRFRERVELAATAAPMRLRPPAPRRGTARGRNDCRRRSTGQRRVSGSRQRLSATTAALAPGSHARSSPKPRRAPCPSSPCPIHRHDDLFRRCDGQRCGIWSGAGERRFRCDRQRPGGCGRGEDGVLSADDGLRAGEGQRRTRCGVRRSVRRRARKRERSRRFRGPASMRRSLASGVESAGSQDQFIRATNERTTGMARMRDSTQVKRTSCPSQSMKGPRMVVGRSSRRPLGAANGKRSTST